MASKRDRFCHWLEIGGHCQCHSGEYIPSMATSALASRHSKRRLLTVNLLGLVEFGKNIDDFLLFQQCSQHV